MVSYSFAICRMNVLSGIERSRSCYKPLRYKLNQKRFIIFAFGLNFEKRKIEKMKGRSEFGSNWAIRG